MKNIEAPQDNRRRRQVLRVGQRIQNLAFVAGFLLAASVYAGYPMTESERAELRSNLLQRIGPIPARCPLHARIVSQEKMGTFTLKKVEYDTEPGLVVPAWLLIPAGPGPFPAILAHHQHGGEFYIGKEQLIRSIKGHEDQVYGRELAERGYVVLAPDSECFAERAGVAMRNYEYNRFWAGVTCGDLLRKRTLWDIVRAVDFLQSLPEVDPERIGMIGHSLGGQETLWGMAFDERIKAGVSSCGFSNYGPVGERYAGPNYHGYVPGFLKITNADQMSRLIAPRPFLMFSATGDVLFVPEAVRPVVDQLRQEYAAWKMPERYDWKTFDGPHSFPMANHQAAFDWFGRWLKNGPAIHVPTRPVEFPRLHSPAPDRARGVIVPGAVFPVDENTLALWRPAETATNGLVRTLGSASVAMQLQSTNPITVVPGRFGKAAHFQGGAHLEGTPRSPLVAPGAPFSVEAWVKTTAAGHPQPIVAQWSYLPNWGEAMTWWLGLTPDGRAGIAFQRGNSEVTGAGSALVASRTRVNDGRWHYLLAACDGAFWQIFVDGDLEGVAQNNFQGGTFAHQITIAASTLGNLPSQVFHFEGDIEEVRLSKCDRSLDGMTVNSSRVAALRKDPEAMRRAIWESAGGIPSDYAPKAGPSKRTEISGFRAEQFAVTITPGLVVPVTLLFPKGTPKALVLLHPRDVADADREALGLTGDASRAGFGLAPKLAEAGFAVAVPETAHGPRYGATSNLLAGIPPCRDFLLTQRALLDVLAARPTFRGLKVATVGSGLGGWQSALIAGLDTRVSAGASLYGFTSASELGCCAAFPPAPVFLPNLANLGDMGGVLSLIAPRPFLIVSAQGDWQYPLNGAAQAVNVARQIADSRQLRFEIDRGLVPLLNLDSLCNRAMGSNALFAADWTPSPSEGRTQDLIAWLQTVLARP